MNDEQILSDTGQNSEARKDSDQQERQYPLLAQRATFIVACRPARHIREPRHSQKETEERTSTLHERRAAGGKIPRDRY